MATGLVLHSAMLCSDPTPIKIYTCWSHLHIPGQVSMAIGFVLYSVRCFRWFSNYSILEGADLIENEQNPWIPPRRMMDSARIRIENLRNPSIIHQLSKHTAHKLLLQKHCTQVTTSKTLHTSCYSKNTTHKLLLQKHCTQVATPKTLHTSWYSKNSAHKLLLQKHCTQVATPKTLHTRCYPKDITHELSWNILWQASTAIGLVLHSMRYDAMQWPNAD